MPASRRKFNEDFKKNAVKLSYTSSKTIKEISDDLGITDNMLSRWRNKYTMDGDKTRNAILEEVVKALRHKILELEIECDMLKKASAYFAKLQK
jgi:transposase